MILTAAYRTDFAQDAVDSRKPLLYLRKPYVFQVAHGPDSGPLPAQLVRLCPRLMKGLSAFWGTRAKIAANSMKTWAACMLGGPGPNADNALKGSFKAWILIFSENR